MTDKYNDIIDLPHHVSSVHAPMPRHDRAAQFSPFAALTGYDAVINEAARKTDSKKIPDEQRKNEIDSCLSFLKHTENTLPEVCVTFFKADEIKNGGEYVTVKGRIRKVDDNNGKLAFYGGEVIPISEIWDIHCELFETSGRETNEQYL